MTAPENHESPSIHDTLEVSLAAARNIIDPLLAELSNPQSVLYRVAADRMARSTTHDAKLGLSPALLTDPSRSGIIVARFQVQAGELPHDVQPATIEQAITLWSVPERKDVPKLQVPEGAEEDVMLLAQSLQMRGGGPVVFAREEISRLRITNRTNLLIAGGARNANQERIRTALAVAQEHDLATPIIATVDRFRDLVPAEQEAVRGFAPNATNEYMLFVDSARANGFEIVPSAYGVDTLPDGSLRVIMKHAETGRQMMVVAPPRLHNENGHRRTGLFNAYQALANHGKAIVGPDFDLQGSDIISVTSTHYGPMAAINNLEAAHALGLRLGSFQSIGDNQPARTPQAHLIEIGLSLNKSGTLMQDLALRQELLSDV